MIKVVFCTDGIFPFMIGGVQRHSRLLIETLAVNSDLEIHVIHPHQEKVFNKSNIIEHSVKGINPNKNYLQECYRYSMRTFEIVKKIPEAIVYSQGLSLWYGIKKIKNKKIINPHGLEPFQAFSLKDKIVAVPFRLIFEYVFRNADYIVSLGGKLTEILSDLLPQQKIIVLANGVNPKEKNTPNFSAIPLKFLFVGRFATNKGIYQLLDAIERLNAKGYEKKLQFTLVGGGPLFKEVTTQFPIANIRFAGSVSDDELNGIYQDSQAMVFPTLFEGMPTVILEAMSYGLPVIASDVGAVSVLVNDQNGFLIKPGDVSGLVDAIIKFISLSDADKILMSNNSLKLVDSKFSWEMIAFYHYSFFKRINIAIQYF